MIQKRGKFKGRKRSSKISSRFKVSPDAKFEYKDINLIQKFLNDRGKILPRRITGISAKKQRDLTTAVKRARYLALLQTGGIK